MLRRVTRVLRVLLFAIGLALLACLPLTFHFACAVHSPYTGLFTQPGAVIAWHDTVLPTDWDAYFGPASPPLSQGAAKLSNPTLPVFTTTVTTYYLGLPLWLLAFICLAWPVTSFILARRRRKGRGFEVEARPGAALPPPES